MNPKIQMISEIIFNITYLGTIWFLVIKMQLKKKHVDENNKKIALLLFGGFLLLAIGDTGHVGFRVLAYGLGGLSKNSLLVGLGALATAITITFLYMIILEIWRIRFQYKRGIIYLLLMTAGVIRLIIFLHPANNWGSHIPPKDWSLYRNLPLMIQGIGVAILLLKDGFISKDTLMKNFSYMIFLSYFFYTPVVLFVQDYPILGTLMIPKTLAYIAMAIIAYKGVFNVEG